MATYINLAISSSPFAPLLLAFITLLLFLTLDKKRRAKNGRQAKRVPPGDTGLPWIGETMEWYRAQTKNRVFEDFIRPRIQKHGSTFKTRLMGSSTVIVNGAEANGFFLSNEFKLVVSSWPSSSVQLMGKHSIMEKTGEHHRSIRGILARCLGTGGLEPLVPKICEVVKAHLVKYWGNQKGEKIIGLYRSAKFLTFTIMCECLLEMEAEKGLFECFEKVLEGVFSPPVNLPGTSFWRARRARVEIESVLVDVVRKKREEMKEKEGTKGSDGGGGTSLLARLVGALIRGEMTEVEVVDNVVLLIFAAHDTTSFAIAMTFKMLAQHPDCYSLLLQEHMEIRRSRGKEGENLTMEELKKMKYTWQVVRETIRLYPPIFGSFRRAIQDIEFDGFTIPKGWKVLWTAYGTHNNEEYFGNPERFDPKRFEEGMTIPPYVYVPFGGGPRMCVGYHLAKLNIIIFVHFVLTTFNWSLLHPNEPVVMDPLPFPSLGMTIKISPKHVIV